LQRVVNLAVEALVQPTAIPSPGITALFGDERVGDHRSLYLTFAQGHIYAVVAHARSAECEAAAIARLRELVRQTQDEVPGVNAGVTGKPVLELDEMRQARRDTDLAAIVSLFLSALIFVFGYHEIRRPLMATGCLLVGIAYTLALPRWPSGLNILTITLVPILIGMAIDFGVHLIARYEEELRRGSSERIAIRKALAFTGIGIFSSGFTTAGAFFAMMLTDFKGIREMGLISGVGLLVCMVPMMTLLPLMLVRGKVSHGTITR
jgi:predicted RND superfamily exporter protein